MTHSRRILVCGSRDWVDYDLLASTLDEAHPTIICHGAARGADSLAGIWSRKRAVPCEVYPAHWRERGKGAGPERNQRMLTEFKPDAIIAFKDGLDRTLRRGGTEHMIRIAREAGVKVWTISHVGRGSFDEATT